MTFLAPRSKQDESGHKQNLLIKAQTQWPRTCFNNNDNISRLYSEVSLLKAAHAGPHVGSFIETLAVDSSRVDDVVATLFSRCSETQLLHTVFRGNWDYLILWNVKINTRSDKRLHSPSENTRECCALVTVWPATSLGLNG